MPMAAPSSVIVVTGRGKDHPGVAEALMKPMVEHDCQVKDIAQFLLEGLLVFTFVIEVSEANSVRLMKDLQRHGKELDMQLDFHFPDAEGGRNDSEEQPGVGENTAVVAIASAKNLSPSVLCAIDGTLQDHGCTVLEVEHRSDNKVANNGEFNKVQMLVRCPPGLTLSTIYMGTTCAGGSSKAGLQRLTNEEGVQVTLRWWDALNRPNGKSLVVFGLSDVLCPYDVLDELLREAGVDPSTVAADESSPWARRGAKVAALKGRSVEATQRLIKRLEFTKGARLVCATLKAMGCRLAILTNTGAHTVAEHVKQQLGMDYVMSQHLGAENGVFTGEYAGETTDVRFRKLDLLKLMADREGIEHRNVIVVGEALRGLRHATAKSMLETFGPNVYFHATKQKDLTLVLYQLGFNGSHVAELRRRYDTTAADAKDAVNSEAAPAGSKNFHVEVSAHNRAPGQLHRIFKPLMDLGQSVSVSTIRQCSLQNGGMCLGVNLTVSESSSERAVKELVFACQQDFQIRWNEQSPGAPLWQSQYQNRHVVTIVQQPRISGATLRALFGALGARGVNCVKIERLSVRELAALSLSVVRPASVSAAELAEALAQVSKAQECDIAIQSDDVDRLLRRMIVFDMDSTLIQQEVIDELAAVSGVGNEVKEITEAAMRGEIDFFGSLKRRVALLQGQEAEGLFRTVKGVIHFNPGAERLCSVLKKLGYKMAVISGGFQQFADEVKRHLRLDYAFANALEVDENTGKLTGKTTGPVVTPQRKRALLYTISNVEGCETSQTIAVGDGSNDIPMLQSSGLGIAFCAKPKVQAVAEFRINQKDLSTVLFLIGLSEHAAERLAQCSDADSQGAPLMAPAPSSSPAKRRRCAP